MGKIDLNEARQTIAASMGNMVLVTAYANAQAALHADEKAAHVGKVIFWPGEVEDTDFANTVFAASYGMKPDTSKPIARYWWEEKNGEIGIASKFYDNWKDKLHSYLEDAGKYGPKRAYEIAVADVITTTTIEATRSQNILDKILGLQTRNYMLNIIPTIIPAPNLIIQFDSFANVGSATPKWPEGQPPPTIGHTESRTTKICWKNVAHISITEEAELMQMHNTMGVLQNWALRDLDRLENSQLSTEIETATAVAGADWGAEEAASSDAVNNPITDIGAHEDTIEGNGFMIDWLAMHPKVARKMNTNSYIRRQVSDTQGTIPVVGSNRVFNLPGITPASVVVDQHLTNTKFSIGSKDAFWMGRGPTIVASYDKETSGIRGWLAKRYLIPFIADGAGIRVGTGVAS